VEFAAGQLVEEDEVLFFWSGADGEVDDPVDGAERGENERENESRVSVDGASQSCAARRLLGRLIGRDDRGRLG